MVTKLKRRLIDMETKFTEYVTSSSFNLSLTKKQIQTISHLLHDNDDMFEYPHLVLTLDALKRKGIVDPNNRRNLTEAGLKVAELLICTGLIGKD